MRAYYNENDRYAARWLENLIAEGHLPPGDVDDRSIKEVTASDLRGYDQCHFFAGVGGWPYALRLAGRHDLSNCWTGSPPCQPFSTAGSRRGTDDDRHLWPSWFSLIQEQEPQYIFGEQVAAAVGHGWLDRVSQDMEDAGYTVGAVVLGAHSAGAPHIRQRLFWVAHTQSHTLESQQSNTRPQPAGGGGMGNGEGVQGGTQHGQPDPGGTPPRADRGSSLSGGPLEHADGPVVATDERGVEQTVGRAGQDGGGRGVDNPEGPQKEIPICETWPTDTFVFCGDGRMRRIEPTIWPLADGVPRRMGQLHSYGNAIVPQVAALFIQEFMALQGGTDAR